MQHLSGGTVYKISIHLALVTKYRYKVINSAILERLEVIFSETCKKWECELTEFNGEPDHVHLLVSINPKVQISAFTNNLKTVSSRLIRKEFPDRCSQFYRKAVFWKIGYCVVSTGGANLEIIEKYIKGQSRPKD